MTSHGPGLKDFLPDGWGGSDAVATAGAPRNPALPPPDSEAIVEALRTVHDPEIPVNIYDLGLVYRLDVNAAGDVAIAMTLTSPGCPVAGALPREVAAAVAAVAGVGQVRVELVWEPPWSRERMTEDARLALGMF